VPTAKPSRTKQNFTSFQSSSTSQESLSPLFPPELLPMRQPVDEAKQNWSPEKQLYRVRFREQPHAYRMGQFRI
jgi:hypothetical protein